VRLALACLALSACSVGSGTGTLAGTLFVHPCTSDSDFGSSPATPGNYNMNPQFFVASPINDFPGPNPQNKISIRVQSSGIRIEQADVMSLVIANELPVAQALNQPIEVGPNTNIRATLSLFITCPSVSTAMELDGTITWSKFGSAAPPNVSNQFRINFEDQLTAQFSFDVVDRRALTLGGSGGVSVTPNVSGHLDGSFDFIVREGRAAQSP
jgi:hypothetical protein